MQLSLSDELVWLHLQFPGEANVPPVGARTDLQALSGSVLICLPSAYRVGGSVHLAGHDILQ